MTTSNEPRAGLPAWLWTPLGHGRSRICWHLFGLAIVFVQVILTGSRFSLENFARYDLSFHMGSLAGLLYLIFGPRWIVMAVNTVLLWIYVAPFITKDVEEMIGEENIFWLALPGLGLLLASLPLMASANRALVSLGGEGARPLHETIGSHHSKMFRLGLSVALLFAAFHKMNADFFIDKISCATVLSGRLATWWDVPFAEHFLPLSPTHVILGELLIPIVLLIHGPAGLLAALCFLIPIGMIGPIGFTMSVYAMAFAFLDARHLDQLKLAFKKGWPVLILMLVVSSATTIIQHNSPRPFTMFFMYQLACMVLLFCAVSMVGLELKAWFGGREEGFKARLKALWGEAPTALAWHRKLLPSSGAARWIVAIFGLVYFLNGFSPYVGLKYRLSFAMLSNLRADTGRWNHPMMPEAMHIPKHDPFVRVTKVVASQSMLRKMKRVPKRHKRGMYKGTFSQRSFKHRIKMLRRLKASPTIELTLEGVPMRFENILHNPGFEVWLDGLSDSKMFQSNLTLDRPQLCVH